MDDTIFIDGKSMIDDEKKQQMSKRASINCTITNRKQDLPIGVIFLQLVRWERERVTKRDPKDAASVAPCQLSITNIAALTSDSRVAIALYYFYGRHSLPSKSMRNMIVSRWLSPNG